MHKTSPNAERVRIHWQHVIGFRDTIEPGFDFRSLGGILFPRHFDTGLQFADGNRREVNVGISD